MSDWVRQMLSGRAWICFLFHSWKHWEAMRGIGLRGVAPCSTCGMRWSFLDPVLPADPCHCGAVSMATVRVHDVYSHIKVEGVHHRRDRCWTPAPFPFPPLPEPGSPEALEEMQRSVPSYVSPDNALVRMLREREAPISPGPDVDSYAGIDRSVAPWSGVPTAETMTIEQAIIEASALMAREANEPDVIAYETHLDRQKRETD